MMNERLVAHIIIFSIFVIGGVIFFTIKHFIDKWLKIGKFEEKPEDEEM